jgi:endonuclease III related protein
MKGQCLILDLLGWDDYCAKVMSTHPLLPGSSLFAPPVSGGRSCHSPAPSLTINLPILQEYFNVLLRSSGPQDWWPGRTRFEIIVGAILTQNTSWTNVERAIQSLRRERLLTPTAMLSTSTNRLASLIRSSGYFRQKARKLKEFVAFLQTQYGGSLSKLFRTPTTVLREQLLGVHGIGPETADSILLYAGNHPVFVVDAYTRRVMERHGLVQEKNTYEGIRGLFERSLPVDVKLFNEFHALIVHVGKNFCRPKSPVCSACPLNCYLPNPIEGAR